MVKKDKDKQALRVITVHVPEATFRRLKLIAASTDMSNAEVIAKAIDMLDVQGVQPAKTPKVRANKTMDNTAGVDWTDELRPGPGEQSIVEPWRPLTSNKQVEPDLSKVGRTRRGA